MSYDQKYKSNLKWAELAEKENDMNIAITRYYYAAFIKVLFDLKEKEIKVDIDANTNQHNNTIRAYADMVIKRDTKAQSRNRTNFLNHMNRLKRARHKAEYEEIDVSEQDVIEVRQAFKFINSFVKI